MARCLRGVDYLEEIAVPSPLTTDNRELKNRQFVERWTSIRSEDFCHLICLDATSSVFLRVFSLVEVIC